MAQVDALRFLARVPTLFTPNIQDGQVFIAYIGEDNSYTIQADNIIRASSSANFNSEEIEELEQRFIALESQAREFQTFCNNVSVLQTQIQTLSGSTENEGNIDFDCAFLKSEIEDIRTDIADLYTQIELLNNQVDNLSS